MASGEMSQPEFTAFLQTVFGHLATYSADGAIHFQCMDWRHCPEILAAGTAAYTELKNICVWAKNNGGMGRSIVRSTSLCSFSSQAPRHTLTMSNWASTADTELTSGATPALTASATIARTLSLHPTVKPVAMVADAIRDCSHRKGIVLDAFVGSGTTLIAAEKTGRRGYGIEIDPAYCDVAIGRLRLYALLKPFWRLQGDPLVRSRPSGLQKSLQIPLPFNAGCQCGTARFPPSGGRY